MSKFGYSVVPRGLLDTKGDIPFPAAQVTIYQPSFKEIAMLGKESDFFIGVKALIKNYKTFEDNSDLSQFSNFQILMTMIAQNNTQDVKLIKNDILSYGKEPRVDNINQYISQNKLFCILFYS